VFQKDEPGKERRGHGPCRWPRRGSMGNPRIGEAGASSWSIAVPSDRRPSAIFTAAVSSRSPKITRRSSGSRRS
jgi:hypothetical protein